MNFFDKASAAFQRETVIVLDNVFLVTTMTIAEKDAMDLALARKGGKGFRAHLLIASVKDAETGEPVFHARDVDRIACLPALAVEPLVEAAVRVNRLSDAETEALAKN